MAVQRIRAVLLKEIPAVEDEPTAVEEEILPPQQTAADHPPVDCCIPTPPYSHPAIISQDDEDNPSSNPIDPPIQPGYTLRSRATHIINSIIFEESPNVVNTKDPVKHISNYGLAVKVLAMQEAFKKDMYSPIGSAPNSNGKVQNHLGEIIHKRGGSVSTR